MTVRHTLPSLVPLSAVVTISMLASLGCKSRSFHQEGSVKDTGNGIKTFGANSTVADEAGCQTLYMKPTSKPRRLYSWTYNPEPLENSKNSETKKAWFTARLAKERAQNAAVTTYKSIGHGNQVGSSIYMAPDPTASFEYGKVLIMTTMKPDSASNVASNKLDTSLFQFFNMTDFPLCYLTTIKNANVGAILYNWQSSKSDAWALGVRNEEMLDFSDGKTEFFDFRIGKRIADLDVTVDPALASETEIVKAFGSYGKLITDYQLRGKFGASVADDDVAWKLILAELWAGPKKVNDAYNSLKSKNPAVVSSIVGSDGLKDNAVGFGEVLSSRLERRGLGGADLALALFEAGYLVAPTVANESDVRGEILKKWRSDPQTVKKADMLLALVPKIAERWKKNTLDDWDMDTDRLKLDPSDTAVTGVTSGNVKATFDGTEGFAPLGGQVLVRQAAKNGWMQVKFNDKWPTPDELRGKSVWARAQIFIPGKHVFTGSD